MPSVNVVAQTKIESTSRIQQLSAIFDCPIEKRQRLEWNVDLPYDDFDWSVGLITGPSGCGKTKIARELFGTDEVDKQLAWHDTRAVVDDFDKSLSMQQITDACSAVGFNTIPAWMRPHHVLSNGERFRAELARRLLEGNDLIVIDEFTSVVDRQVAKIAAYAVQKYIRKKSKGKKFVAVTCHYDVVDWLQPDWIFDPSTNQFTRGSVRRRPSLNIEICGCPYSTWEIFAPFHYMTRDLSKAARCFSLWVDGNLAGFSAMLHRPNSSDGEINVWGLSRTVTLPDYQGLGLFFVLNETLASAFSAVGKKFNIYPVHPPFVHNVAQSNNWKMLKKPAYQAGSQSIAKNQSNNGATGKGFGKRPCAIFEYVGPKMDRKEAEKLLSYHGRWPGITYRYATTRGANA